MTSTVSLGNADLSIGLVSRLRMMGQELVMDPAEELKLEANNFFQSNSPIYFIHIPDGEYDAAGYYRRATVYLALEKFKEARDDFDAVLKLSPNNKTALVKRQECQQLCRRKMFAQAIALDIKDSPIESVDPLSIVVESSYTGPNMEEKEDGSFIVTQKFMADLLEHFRLEKKLHKKYALIIMKQVYDQLRQLESLIDVDIPISSARKLIVSAGLESKDKAKLSGNWSATCYQVFNSDIEWNHESENMNRLYGFEAEVKSKYSSEMADMFTDIFNWLPLGHLLNSRILNYADYPSTVPRVGDPQQNIPTVYTKIARGIEYHATWCTDIHCRQFHDLGDGFWHSVLTRVMHGGLPDKDDVTLDQIRKISRNCQPPEGSTMCHLLWSDPMNTPGLSASKRGIGCQFGPDITHKFCKANGLDYIIRSHEVKPTGYEVAHDGRCITVFSAPNYCDTMHNLAAFIILEGQPRDKPMEPNFKCFKEVPHPAVRPMAYVNPLISMFM